MIICIDGMQFGEHVMIGAVGVDVEGHKHVPAIRAGASENGTVAKELLEDLVARGVKPDQKRLFVIDGSKALRVAINAVFGTQHPVQRCRAHKLRNVLDHLPQEQKGQVKSAMRAAWKLDAEAGLARMKKLAEWLERDHPAAGSQLAGGTGRVLDPQPAGRSALSAPLPGQHQRHRESAFWRAHADAPCLPLAR